MNKPANSSEWLIDMGIGDVHEDDRSTGSSSYGSPNGTLHPKCIRRLTTATRRRSSAGPNKLRVPASNPQYDDFVNILLGVIGVTKES